MNNTQVINAQYQMNVYCQLCTAVCFNEVLV